ncbi:hypothetical protein P7K49_036357 [Saguinus oedipus]|uniref:Uncharacterized protein n=1 Tax=Saguinus oedipus TaxID=9490 RepID=A0ABQ9TLK4_SAGOE|nr:hypothetical protein P7K49_036357 [Saguinus oedipus]
MKDVTHGKPAEQDGWRKIHHEPAIPASLLSNPSSGNTGNTGLERQLEGIVGRCQSPWRGLTRLEVNAQKEHLLHGVNKNGHHLLRQRPRVSIHTGHALTRPTWQLPTQN